MNDTLPVPLNDRSFDLILLSNWEDQIIYGPQGTSTSGPSQNNEGLTTPINKVLESGAWTQSIIWSPTVPFRDFTQIEFNHEDDIVPEERPPGQSSKPIDCEFYAYEILLQRMGCAPGNEHAQMLLRSRTSSTSRMTTITKFPQRRVLVNVSGKRLVNWLSSTHIQLRSYSFPLCVYYFFIGLSLILTIRPCQVQNSAVKTRGSLMASTCTSIPSQRRASVCQGPYSKKEKGQVGTKIGQRWQHWRRSS
jgi:hypothetical protein